MARSVKRVALDEMVKVLDRIPIVSGIKDDLSGLQGLLVDRRTPRIAALGWPGSGRSTLLRALIERHAANALQADHGEWVSIEHEGAKIDWLELDINKPDAAAQWGQALEDCKPDLILLMIEPTNVDKAGELMKQVQLLLKRIETEDQPIRIFPLLTHVDLIGDTDHQVETMRRQVAQHIRASGIHADPPRAVSSISGHGLTGLSEAMVLALPEEARLEAARALTRAKEGRLRLGQQIVQACTSVSVTVGLTPIPFSDMAILAPLQVMMVSSIAYMSGRSWSRKAVAEWLASLGVVGGVGFGLRYMAQGALKFIPGAGTMVSAGVAAAGTTAMGQSAIRYFLRKTPG